MEVLLASLWVALVLYLVYETSVVYSYLSRLPFLNFITHIKEYESERKDNWSLSYSLFMQLNHGGFLLDLLMCRYCLGFWLALGASYFCGVQYVAPIYFMSQLEYSVFRATEKTLFKVGENSDE
jgi:hypothetical protein